MEITQNENEKIENLKQKIIKDLELNPTDGINTFESILLGEEKDIISFDEYLDRLQKTLKKCTCQASWMKPTLTIHCSDCQKSSNCCICVPCFFKGNHQGHKVYLTHSSNGTCDCGDPLLWSKSGFCCDHPGPEPNPELTQLDNDTRVKLISIFKAAFHFYLQFATFDKQSFLNITNWITRIVSLGDATRRCVCLALRESFEFIDLYLHCINLEKDEIAALLKLLGALTNDEVFRTYFSLSFLRNLPKFIWINNRMALGNKDPSKPPLSAANKLFGFTFHATTTFTVQKLIRESQLDWAQVIIKSLHLFLAYNFSQMSKEYNENSRRFSSFCKILSLFKSAFKVYDSTNTEVITFVENVAEILVTKEFSFCISRKFGEKLNDMQKTQSAMFSIYFDMFHLVSKINSREIYTTKPLKILKDFFDSKQFQSIDQLSQNNKNDEGEKKNISNKEEIKMRIKKSKEPKNDSDENNDNNDQKKINLINDDVFYHSVLCENVQFAQSYPTHILAYVCLNLKDKKTLHDYISEVTDDVNGFVKKWALIPLRWLAASDLSDYQLFIRNSQSTLTAMHSFKFKKNIKYKFVPIFSLLQNLMKTTSDIDDFYLMIISTFGFFKNKDDDERYKLDDNQKRLIYFNIFHFISCLIFDTLCSEKNLFTIRRLIVITSLMNGSMSIEDLNSVWYKKILSDDTFCEDLQSFASRVSTKNGTKFNLTDSSDWHPLLPFLSMTTIISRIQDFINKNPDSLIKFPKLPPDSERFLFTPTLWALEYHILSHKTCKDYQIIHQLIFNVLIITANNDELSSSDDDSNDTVLAASDFNELTIELKKLTFSQFLRKKILYPKSHKSASFDKTFKEQQQAFSMIDQIRSFGTIGVTVLERMNVHGDASRSPSEDSLLMKEEMQKKNRERASKLKMEIMSNFTQKQKSFKSQEDTEKVENVDEFECSICHLENEKDCFVYPALIYKSPLSSYLNWRFRNATLIDQSHHRSDNDMNDEANSTNNDNKNKNDNDNNNDGNNDVVEGLDGRNIGEFDRMPPEFALFSTVRICLHPIHSCCIHRSKFTCPTDRCPRNASLPIISGTFDYKPIADNSVLKSARDFLENAYHEDIKYAVMSLASEIEILEVRHRSNPGCLDDVTMSSTLRNVYLCIWHVMRSSSQKVLIDEENIRRMKIVTDAVKCEIKGSSSDVNVLTWSQMKEKFPRLRRLPDVDKSLSLADNSNRIFAVLITPNETKDDDDGGDVKSTTSNEKMPHLTSPENNDESNDDEEEEDVEAITISASDFQSVEEQNTRQGDFEIFLDENKKIVKRPRIYLSPLMKYVLHSMLTESDPIDMRKFISGYLFPPSIVKNDSLIQCDDQDDDQDDILFRDTDLLNDLSTDYKMLRFLRCAAIFDHFSRGLKLTSRDDKDNDRNGEFIEWDAILSFSSLRKHYGIDKNEEGEDENAQIEMVLPMFSFASVPKNYLDFIHPPFSAPILTTDEGNIALCLLTGKVVVMPSEQGRANGNHIRLDEFLKKQFAKSFTILLNLNGGGATQVIITSLEFNLILPMQTFYVDKFGDKDIGIRRGSLLYLNESKREEIIDNFLSGVWTNSVKWPLLRQI